MNNVLMLQMLPVAGLLDQCEDSAVSCNSEASCFSQASCFSNVSRAPEAVE